MVRLPLNVVPNLTAREYAGRPALAQRAFGKSCKKNGSNFSNVSLVGR